MSVDTEIERINTAKQSIKVSVASKGVTIPDTEKIDTYSSYIDQISTGGGGGVDTTVYKNILGRRDLSQPSMTSYSYTLTIPQEITELGPYALAGLLDGKVTIVLPTTLEKLGYRCFYQTAFDPEVTVVIPEGITELPYSCFEECNNASYGLTTVSLPETLTSIGKFAFMSNEFLTSLTIPNAVSSIGDYAFSKCKSLTSVNLPSSLTSISSYLFEGSKALTVIDIPEAVMEIKGYAFRDCTGLTSVTFSENLSNIEPAAFERCEKLSSISSIGATSLGYDCFIGCKSLTEITLTNITAIPDRCFWGCSALTTVNAPNVTEVKTYAFAECVSLTNFTSSKLTFIGDSAFADSGITSIDLSGITKDSDLEWGAFRGCSKLASIVFPEGVLTYINGSMFSGCVSLTTVDIPEGVTNIYNAFSGCSGLTTLTIPNSVVHIESDGLSGVTSNCTIIIDNVEGAIEGAPWGSEAEIVYLR